MRFKLSAQHIGTGERISELHADLDSALESAIQFAEETTGREGEGSSALADDELDIRIVPLPWSELRVHVRRRIHARLERRARQLRIGATSYGIGGEPRAERIERALARELLSARSAACRYEQPSYSRGQLFGPLSR
jgi:hypothetical protein